MIKCLIASLFAIAVWSGNAQIAQKAKSKILQKKPITANKPAVIKPETPPVVEIPAAPPDTTTAVANMGMIKTFNNYDFIPGDTVVFEDHFEDDQAGEFPAHWNLGAGQGVMNMAAGKKALLLTAGNGAHVSPLIKGPVYFSDAFTIEFDWYINAGYAPKIYFYNTTADAKSASNDLGQISFSTSSVNATAPDVDLSGNVPEEIRTEENQNTWHHVALACKKNQVKVYIDQHRVLVVPNIGFMAHAFDIEGIGDETNPIVMANFRVAKGAGMNMLGQKFTAAKIVTHGINFDIDKATIRPESMGTLNMIVSVLKDNPDIKFEIDGHTDNTGLAAHNLTLSQQRAASVKAQLVAMGIDAARLTTKGFGSTKPLSDNATPEGKANNRRVEFIKM